MGRAIAPRKQRSIRCAATVTRVEGTTRKPPGCGGACHSRHPRGPHFGPFNVPHLYRSPFQLVFVDCIPDRDGPVESFESLPDLLGPGTVLPLAGVGPHESSAGGLLYTSPSPRDS